MKDGNEGAVTQEMRLLNALVLNATTKKKKSIYKMNPKTWTINIFKISIQKLKFFICTFFFCCRRHAVVNHEEPGS